MGRRRCCLEFNNQRLQQRVVGLLQEKNDDWKRGSRCTVTQVTKSKRSTEKADGKSQQIEKIRGRSKRSRCRCRICMYSVRDVLETFPNLNRVRARSTWSQTRQPAKCWCTPEVDLEFNRVSGHGWIAYVLTANGHPWFAVFCVSAPTVVQGCEKCLRQKFLQNIMIEEDILL